MSKGVDLKAAILAAQDRPTLGPVKVPEWGVSVYLRELSGAERFSVSRQLSDDKDIDASAVLLTLSIVDEAGARIFSDDDAPALAQKNSAVLVRLMQEMSRLSALGQEGLDRAKKPSGKTPD